MKKYIFMVVAALALTSCTTTIKTARVESVPYSMFNATVADLNAVGNRITYTMTPSKEIQRGGIANCKQAAINEALTANGNADMLLEPQFVISKKLTWCGIKITSVTVTGIPAKYSNFRSLPDEVWTDPVFRKNGNVSIHYFNGEAPTGHKK